jgi:hypothetical protein
VEFVDRVGISYLGIEEYSTGIRLVKETGTLRIGVYPTGVEVVTGVEFSCSGIEGYPTGVRLVDRAGVWRSEVERYFTGVEEHSVVATLVDGIRALYSEAGGNSVRGVLVENTGIS